MTMTDTQTMNPTAPGNRLVTVDDLRYELQRERAITDARFGQVDARFEQIDARFEQIDTRFEQIDTRFDRLEARVDARFDQVDARFGQVDARFDRLEARFEARFDFLEQRLRFNKTLIVASLSAVASVASVVVSLLK
jgi:uncharacterized protein (DUF3084 family)